jgi:hypothetical protein
LHGVPLTKMSRQLTRNTVSLFRLPLALDERNSSN